MVENQRSILMIQGCYRRIQCFIFQPPPQSRADKTYPENMNTLQQLHQDIENRVDSIRENRPDWLCGKGCDHCCKRLADVPQLTATEWKLLQEGLTALRAERLAEIGQYMAALAPPVVRPVTCPLLNRATGACPAYLQRPVACRTYGFYAQRELGLYCHDIEAQVADGALADVVWGNHDAIDQRLACLGETLPLTEWYARWQSGMQTP